MYQKVIEMSRQPKTTLTVEAIATANKDLLTKHDEAISQALISKWGTFRQKLDQTSQLMTDASDKIGKDASGFLRLVEGIKNSVADVVGQAKKDQSVVNTVSLPVTDPWNAR